MPKYKWKQHKKSNIKSDVPFTIRSNHIEIHKSGLYRISTSLFDYQDNIFPLMQVEVNGEPVARGTQCDFEMNIEEESTITFRSALMNGKVRVYIMSNGSHGSYQAISTLGSVFPHLGFVPQSYAGEGIVSCFNLRQ